MNEKEEIRKIKEDWAAEFGSEILNDEHGVLPENWAEVKTKLRSIPLDQNTETSTSKDQKGLFPIWVWPLLAAATIIAAIWIYLPDSKDPVQEIDWAILDDVEVNELHLFLEDSYIYDLASENHEELDELNEFSIEDETFEDWLETEKDILLWVE